MIRPTTGADLPDLLALWSDPEVMRWVGFPDGLGWGWEEISDWYRRLVASPTRHHFVVVDDGGGFCGEAYYAVDADHRRASLDIKLSPRARGRGLGTAALTSVIDQVFASEPGVDAVWTEPAVSNDRARILYARCGLAPATRPADLGPGEYWERRRASRSGPGASP